MIAWKLVWRLPDSTESWIETGPYSPASYLALSCVLLSVWWPGVGKEYFCCVWGVFWILLIYFWIEPIRCCMKAICLRTDLVLSVWRSGPMKTPASWVIFCRSSWEMTWVLTRLFLRAWLKWSSVKSSEEFVFELLRRCCYYCKRR